MPPVSQFPNKPFEIRDPVHGFITLNETEQRVIDTRPLQRLKHIHQLAMTYQVYPGATHKRFEHSLGVMELAGRAFDVVTNSVSLDAEVRSAFPGVFRAKDSRERLSYWRSVVRLAALCHDIGHLPFSHAAEKELLSDGVSHETISGDLITDDEGLAGIWKTAMVPVRPEHIKKLALGSDKCAKLGIDLTPWERVMSDLIVDDSLGADRMDYLLRDSHHLGVAYGRFDVDRLIQSLRLLPIGSEQSRTTVALGIDEGGIHATEGLLQARYFMFMQVYYHHARLAYDLHLVDFVKRWFRDNDTVIDRNTILELTDIEILAAIANACRDGDDELRMLAKRIHGRQHYRRLHAADQVRDALPHLSEFRRLGAACEKTFPRHVDTKVVLVSAPERDVPVRRWHRNQLSSFSQVSDIASLMNRPDESVANGRAYIFVSREKEKEARRWLDSRLRNDHDDAAMTTTTEDTSP